MSKETANVIAPPPVLFVGALVIGLVIDWLFGWHLPMPLFARSLLGLIVVLIGAIPLGLALIELRRANTPVEPWKPTRQIVTEGPYRFTRNPIYIGMSFIYLGLVIVFGSGAGFLLLLPVLVTLHFGVVLREEAYLAARFGKLYEAYCEKTPRWLQ